METLRNRLLNSTFADEFESISVSMVDVEHQMYLAVRHLVTAGEIDEQDPDAILQMCYSAARKSLQAVLSAAGLRVKQPPGNHWTLIKLTRLEVFSEDVWVDLKWLRERRNDAEYFTLDAPTISGIEAREALAAATEMIADAKRIIDSIN